MTYEIGDARSRKLGAVVGNATADQQTPSESSRAALSSPEVEEVAGLREANAASAQTLPHLAPGDWKHEHPTTWIWAPSLKGGYTHVADVRGWGYLTGGGHGALGLSGDEAGAAQEAWGDYIVHAVNSHAALLARISRLEDELRAAREGGALGEIAVERQRQIAVEGWSPDHDNEHRNGELAKAAACYARGEPGRRKGGYWAGAGRDGSDDYWVPAGYSLWPWDAEWWKPGDRRRMLVKAGALIVAEIERLDRAALLSPPAQGEGQ